MIVHRDVQLALAEAAEGHMDLLGGHYDASDDDEGDPHHDDGGDTAAKVADLKQRLEELEKIYPLENKSELNAFVG